MKSMANSLIILSFFFFLTSVSSQNPNPTPLTAHDELKTNGFPIGLLPTNVLTYSLNRTSGDFAVDLGDTCKLLLPPDNYLATYSKRITGKLIASRIAELKGIRVWAFFQWWSITGIRLSGDNLVFEVGMVTVKYPSKNFDETPACQGQRQRASS